MAAPRIFSAVTTEWRGGGGLKVNTYIHIHIAIAIAIERERERERAAAATATALVWGGLREENVGGVSTRARNGVDDTILVLMFSVGECGQGVLFVRVSARRQTTRERREEP